MCSEVTSSDKCNLATDSDNLIIASNYLTVIGM